MHRYFIKYYCALLELYVGVDAVAVAIEHCQSTELHNLNLELR